MSKLETPMVVAYWEKIGGTLMEEFPLVTRNGDSSGRWADAVIVSNCERRRLVRGMRVEIEGQDVIVVQAKARRLGMYIMGQGIFSAELMKRLKPKSVKSIILCTKDDATLRPLLAPFPSVEVVVMPEFAMPNMP